MNIIRLILNLLRKPNQPVFLYKVTGVKVHNKAREECLHVLPLDNQYKAITLDSFVKYMDINTISDMPYVIDDHDCEDFAFESYVDVRRWSAGCPIGIVFGNDTSNKPHSWNCFYDVAHEQLYYFEPQDDTLYLPTTEKEWEILI